MRKHARKSRFLKTGFLASAIGLLTYVSGHANAADWSLKYNTSTDLELTDNYSGTNVNKDTALKLSTRSSMDLLAKTKTQLFRISPSLTTRRTFFANTNSGFDVFPSIGIGYNYDGKRTSFGVDAYVAQAAIRSDNLWMVGGKTVLDQNKNPLVKSTENGSEFDFGANMSLSHKLTLRDTVSWSAGFSSVEYSINTNTLDPNDTITTNVSWQRNLTKLVSASAAIGVSYYRPQKHPSDDRVTYNPNVSISAQLTKRLSGSASAGVSYTDPSNGKSTFGAVGSVSGTYALKRSKISLALSRDFSNAVNGSLRDRYSAQFNVAHSLNDLMSLGFAAGYAFSPVSGAADEQSITFSPSLSYQLARDWNTSLSYTISDDDNGNAKWTNAILFNVSYGKTLLK
jgi:hypothetical protein